LVESMPVNRRL